MPLYQAIILAVVQGLTEFLPVSSSAHLALVPWLMRWHDPGLAFDIAMHVGTLVAVLLYFGRDWFQILANGLGFLGIRTKGGDPELRENKNLLWLLALGSLPIGFFGYLFQKEAETTLRNPYLIGIMLILVGVLMDYGDRIGRQRKDLGLINGSDAWWVGLAQALAIVPGTSRSGITITAGRFRDLDRPAAARFSFLLSTPAIAAAAGSAFHHLKKAGGVPPGMKLPFLTGIIVSGVVGSVVISVFLKFLQRFSLRVFVIYRIIFGIIVIALAYFLHYQAA